MVLSTHGALSGFNVRFTGNACTWIFISLFSLSAPPLLFPLLCSLSSCLILSYVSYQEPVLWSGPELSSGYEIRPFIPCGLHAWQHNNTKVLVRAQLQKRAPNGAVIMMYSFQDIDVRHCHPPPRVARLSWCWQRGSCCSSPPFGVMSAGLCALHIKSLMEAVKCVLNGKELAEWKYNWISA